jgi:hypothetical protein
MRNLKKEQEELRRNGPKTANPVGPCSRCDETKDLPIRLDVGVGRAFRFCSFECLLALVLGVNALRSS